MEGKSHFFNAPLVQKHIFFHSNDRVTNSEFLRYTPRNSKMPLLKVNYVHRAVIPDLVSEYIVHPIGSTSEPHVDQESRQWALSPQRSSVVIFVRVQFYSQYKGQTGTLSLKWTSSLFVTSRQNRALEVLPQVHSESLES